MNLTALVFFQSLLAIPIIAILFTLSNPTLKRIFRCASALIILFAALAIISANAQTPAPPHAAAVAPTVKPQQIVLGNSWTWKDGSNLVDPLSFEYPAPRYGGAYWKDSNGNLWLFGGYVYNDESEGCSCGSEGYTNDLWMFNPSTEAWSMVTGYLSLNQMGIYGNQGQPGSFNTPGSRFAAAFATDSQGNFWLFGGSGIDENWQQGLLNDLWEFNPNTLEWTWWGGSQYVNQTAVYGAQGAGSIIYQPYAELGSAMWIDSNGNPWIFGGYSDLGYQNDVWEFTPSNLEWTLQQGNPAVSYLPPVYSGTPSSITPGGIFDGLSWIDSNGKFWFFSGDSFTVGYTNTLWSYNTNTNNWTFENAATYTNHFGVYGTEGTYDPLNIPGARYVSSRATDSSGNLWLFGGIGFNQSSSDLLNDLMLFSDTSNEWVWMSGSATLAKITGVYGTQNSPSVSNYPGSRWSAYSWIDNYGNFWLFGGLGIDSAGNYGYLNDLWEYQPYITTTSSLTSSLNPSTYGQSVTFTASVSPTSGSTTPTGAIQFSINGSPAGSAVPLVNGEATYTTTTLAAGTDTISAVFNPTGIYTTSTSNTISQVVSKATPTITTWPTASPLTYGQPLSASTLIGGTASVPGSFTFTTPNAIPPVGTDSESVTFTPTSSADYNYVIGTVIVTVSKATPTVTLTSTPAFSTFGVTVIFTATLPATASGSVAFKNGITTLSTVSLINGKATFATSWLSVATHYITAVYSGDASYNSATSSILKYIVSKATPPVILTSSLNPSTYGQSVTFTSTLPNIATGTVTFKDGAATLSKVTLLRGRKATYASTALAKGAHSITASYSGDINYNPATSSVLTQKVN